MTDSFGRAITYLRVSVTELCNLRCQYCMPAEGVRKRSHADMLTEEELLRAVRIAAQLGVTKVRVTGGEPLVQRSGNRFGGRLDIGRAVALTGRGMQRELAHHQYFAADLPHVEIHHPVFVVENPQPGEFTRKPLDILLAVLGFDTDENQQPRSDGRFEGSADGNRRTAHPLNQNSHGNNENCRAKNAQRLSSFGTGAVTTIRSRRTGWMKSTRYEWSEMPPSGFERRAPYFKSPLIGQPIFESCARI